MLLGENQWRGLVPHASSNMHALYHLPNLVSHPTPRPTSKPTPWRTWGNKPGANPHSGWLSAARFAPGFSGADFEHLCPPLTQGAVPTLRCAVQDLHPPHHLHNITWHEDMLHAMHLPLESIRAPFKFHIHAILTPHMRMTCGLLHAIHTCHHP